MVCCNKCNKTPCGCNKTTYATPRPFYADVPSCEEDNCEKIYIQQFSLGLQIQSSWNIPVCGGAALLSVPGVFAVPIGSYIWNVNFGYYLVVSFDAILQQVSIQNPCFTINALPGTEVPMCTIFVITPPPCCEDIGQSGVFLAVDFTAPEEDACIDITLTSEEGLVAGNNVQIGSGVYLLSAVKADNVITICNEGEGIIPGTSVIAKNVSGQFQYPVRSLSVNACSKPPVFSGKVIVCDDLTNTSLVGGVMSSNGDLLTLVDSVTGVAQYSGAEATARIAGDSALQSQITNMLSIEASVQTVTTPGSLTIITPLLQSNEASITIVNSSTTKTMVLFLAACVEYNGTIASGPSLGTGDPINYMDLQTLLQLSLFGPYTNILNISKALIIPGTDAGGFLYGDQFSHSFTASIPLNTTGTIKARAQLIRAGGVLLTGYNVVDLIVKLSVIGTSN